MSTPAWRTTFGGGLSAFYMVGMVLIFIVGKVGVDRKYFSLQTKYFCCVQAVSWRVLAGFCCVFPLLSSVLLLLIPESPSWLVTQGRHHQPPASAPAPASTCTRQVGGGQAGAAVAPRPGL